MLAGLGLCCNKDGRRNIFRHLQKFIGLRMIDLHVNIMITEQKKMLAEEKQTKVDVIHEEESNGVIEVVVPEQFSPEK